MTAIALTIAGSDSGGGAGIQADLKTFSALGVYGASVITALTAQNTHGVTGIHDVPADFIAAQMDAVFSDLAVDAVKIGMLSQPETIRTVAAGLERHGARNIVLDPVMVAASGDPLLAGDAVAELIATLVPKADLITPNLHEAARMLSSPVAETRADMADQAKRLLSLGARRVLLKGGHGAGDECADLLTDGAHEKWFVAPRHETRNTHGTGCTLSSAISAGLAKGLSMADSVAEAKIYITDAVRAADALEIGSGHGPVHHFHRQWTEHSQ
ncbi:bifunctional hydroxymethylpyrimidine kinase/phosphomethylpyrimidine kinase [Rhizobiales bacterium]|uniref:bifunctional hydroxymethylpyrimidine kinase/phosphomethylpyrimidine kinase n=1 Tax=Hongsoonwoonella zoysiae TaxID=2821844 RepID=UPI001560D118|nr:bifunctional hydroxymethylpyrimidine kinase/phosphomethylpyrimidine kinase [Hongsoonwoonella zoysiae]NRG17964.1 bifunctional hydroxymethylpyrimidine kinase/phosphomethylpyrimidine kinase [Hongsoonwoonella zoysiae]